MFEIDLVKQPFSVRTIFFDVLFRYAFFVKIHFGRLASFLYFL